jgi:hypothetical protein
LIQKVAKKTRQNNASTLSEKFKEFHAKLASLFAGPALAGFHSRPRLARCFALPPLHQSVDWYWGCVKIVLPQ